VTTSRLCLASEEDTLQQLLFKNSKQITVLTEVSFRDLASMLSKLNVRQKPSTIILSLLADIPT